VRNRPQHADRVVEKDPADCLREGGHTPERRWIQRNIKAPDWRGKRRAGGLNSFNALGLLIMFLVLGGGGTTTKRVAKGKRARKLLLPGGIEMQVAGKRNETGEKKDKGLVKDSYYADNYDKNAIWDMEGAF